MKKAITIKKGFVLAIVTLAMATAEAQKGLDVNLAYNLGIPLGDAFRRYDRKSSFGSFQGSVMYNLSARLAVGAQMSYTDYHRRISTEEENTVRLTPVWAKVEYTILDKGPIRPYAGAGGGINSIHYKKVKGATEVKKNDTKSSFTFDVGAKIPFSKSGRFGARVSTSYNLQTFKHEDIRNLDCWNVQVGVGIPITK